MFKKAQPGTVPMRMYHSPGSTHTPIEALVPEALSTAQHPEITPMKEASYVENAIQGHIYPI